MRTVGVGRPAVVGARSRSPEDLGRRRIELKVWDGAGPSDGGGESGIFKHKGQGQARWAFRA